MGNQGYLDNFKRITYQLAPDQEDSDDGIVCLNQKEYSAIAKKIDSIPENRITYSPAGFPSSTQLYLIHGGIIETGRVINLKRTTVIHETEEGLEKIVAFLRS